jgi:hypothetical protein
MSPEQLELLYFRRVLVGILEVTVEDLTNERKLIGKNSKRDQEQNKREALAFIRSSTFDLVCDAVGVPACRIRTKCLS